MSLHMFSVFNLDRIERIVRTAFYFSVIFSGLTFVVGFWQWQFYSYPKTESFDGLYTTVMLMLNVVFTFLFSVEAVLKIIAFGPKVGKITLQAFWLKLNINLQSDLLNITLLRWFDTTLDVKSFHGYGVPIVWYAPNEKVSQFLDGIIFKGIQS